MFLFYQKHSPKVNLTRSNWSSPRDADLLAVMIVLSRLLVSIFFLQSTPSPFLAYFVSCSFHPIHDPRIIIIFAQFPMMIYEPDCYDLFWWLYVKKTKALWCQSIIEKTTMSSQTTAVITVVDFSHITHIMDGALCVPYILVILWIFNQEYGFSMVWIELIKRFFSILKIWENLSHLGNVHRSLDGMG